MFKVHIDGLDGTLEWGKPTLVEAIALARSELAERRPPVNASITDSAAELRVWEGAKSTSGVVTGAGIAHPG
jgi:hypothetical protein